MALLHSTTVSKACYKAEEELAAKLNSLNATPDDFNDAGNEDDLCLGAHPEGYKRGGAVTIYAEADEATDYNPRVFYDQIDEQWVAYDDPVDDDENDD